MKMLEVPVLTASDLSRFSAKVGSADETGCRRWSGKHTTDGYGRFSIKIAGKWRIIAAQRIAYTIANGPIPPTLVIDHVRARGCRFRDCMEPAHLEAVTVGENSLRGDTINARNAATIHCPRGHSLTGTNLLFEKGRRRCRTCRLLQIRTYQRVYRARIAVGGRRAG